MKVNLDRTSSGFCIGVQGTIHVAEEKLRESGTLYSLGDVVHNEVEVHRLEQLGLKTIDTTTYEQLGNAEVLIRAHGEPPATYETARKNNLTITDTTCPVVSKLQKTAQMLHHLGYQVVIYGKSAHPEVIGINGQCDNRAVIIKHADLSDGAEIEKLDLNHKTALISQTTMDMPGFYELKKSLERLFSSSAALHQDDEAAHWMAIRDIDITEEIMGIRPLPPLVYKDTICRQVSSRNDKLHDFAHANECIVFVAGRKSSNGQVLYLICREANPQSHFIEDVDEVKPEWFSRPDGTPIKSVGICGATSTPMWLLEKVAAHIERTYGHDPSAPVTRQ
ncbi:MAG: 4-hydroxy-3-methylbut-2-enyl diphosphate reductase [Chlorobiaceae bacterium]|nr:4-hydroxy-3-methylbut-2-enyl diphosphate reductase [Chlorobiaceae bacterium]